MGRLQGWKSHPKVGNLLYCEIPARSNADGYSSGIDGQVKVWSVASSQCVSAIHIIGCECYVPISPEPVDLEGRHFTTIGYSQGSPADGGNGSEEPEGEASSNGERAEYSPTLQARREHALHLRFCLLGFAGACLLLLQSPPFFRHTEDGLAFNL